jgi:transcriptional regulator with XRE-family HTH domain
MGKRKRITQRPLLELLELAEQRERWNQKVGESLRQARLEAGLSQEGLAQRLDASQAYVSQVEHGKGLSVEQLRLFADALEEEAKGDKEDEGRKQERKRPRGT